MDFHFTYSVFFYSKINVATFTDSHKNTDK